ncbi:metalloregulator ArsR/SmtB family transcription factor [Psychrobacter aestuarii]|uniref:HTH arsR-type domain-containing protein n=1 Tax=Psychrobacter aestuarii TaxID=556327 RepID=A0ABN0VTY1_9GAMM|nr:metalloregulator ArsR/SmtB family transcription factor [Psychrobacter aestuarii]
MTTKTPTPPHTASSEDANTTVEMTAPFASQVDAEALTTHMQSASKQASQLLKSLSHPDRLLLLCQLTQGEYCVSELEAQVGIGQPSLSQQLGILRKDKLVSTRRAGKQIYYRIASDDAMAILALLYERFCAKTPAS